MPSLFPRLLSIVALVVCVGLHSACLVRARKTAELPVITQTATLDELKQPLESFGEIQSMKANVEFRLAVEDEERTEVREFRDAPGFILARRPSEIRIIAQVPVVRSMAFQMASSEGQFQVHLPSQKRFFVGDANSSQRSEKRTENIRPQHILEAILIEPPRPQEVAVLENTIEDLTPFQVVELIETEGEKATITRKFWFNRNTQELERMQILDDRGNTATLALYEEWVEQDSHAFPTIVTINRPVDGYTVRIRFLDPGLNETVPEDSFVLEVPEGMEVERLGEAETQAAKANPGPEAQ